MLTRRVGEFASAAGAGAVDADTREHAKTGIIDAIAVMLAGRTQEPVAIVRRACPSGPGHATELHGLDRLAPDAAALINGVAAHVLDFDDVALRGHPSAVLVPALLALAEHTDASGKQLLDAYVAGYQAWGELAFRDQDMLHMKGWHPTGVFGAVGSAAACAALLGLDADACAHAVGLGATQSAGLMANFGSMAKPLQAGRAAQAGVTAALLARHGYTAGADVLEHPQGFLRAFSPAGRVEVSAPDRGAREWLVRTRPVSIKKYPTCYYTHRAVDAMLGIRERVLATSGEVASVQVHMSREHATVLRNHAPDDALSAKFSIEFAMACALTRGSLTLMDLRDAVVQSAEIQALMRKVSVIPASDYSDTWTGAARADRVVVTFADGERIESPEVVRPRGDAADPLSRADLEGKFMSCAAASGMPLDSDALLRRLWRLDELPIRGLFA